MRLRIRDSFWPRSGPFTRRIPCGRAPCAHSSPEPPRSHGDPLDSSHRRCEKEDVMSARHARLIILSTLLLGVAGAARVHDRLSASARDIRGATFADRVADYATLRGHVLEQLARSDPRADLSDAA